MQIKFPSAAINKIALVIIFLSATFSCQKDVSNQDRSQLQRANSTSLDELATANHAPYNLNVILFGAGDNGGFIKFLQNKDTAKIVNLNTIVGNLRPNRVYLLQRAVNLITDTTKCSSTAWLTLGEGLSPKSIVTDAQGNGKANLWRDVSSAGSGAEFYIHFQVIDSATAKVALTSGCYQYTVR